jgi:hypothetical protein
MRLSPTARKLIRLSRGGSVVVVASVVVVGAVVGAVLGSVLGAVLVAVVTVVAAVMGAIVKLSVVSASLIGSHPVSKNSTMAKTAVSFLIDINITENNR